MKKVFLFACLISAVTIRFSFAQQYWHRVDGGCGITGGSNSVLSMVNDTQNNVLYSLGVFNVIDDTIGCSSIGAWNGITWSAIINFTSDPPTYRGVMYQNHLIVSWSNSLNHYGVSRYDSLSSWTLLANFNDVVLCLCVYHNKLYVGGSFTDVDGIQARGIACYDGTNWSEPDGGIANTQFSGAEVRAMCVWNDKLIVGGIFDQAGGTFHNSIAAWNDTLWSDLAGGVTYTSPTNVAFVNAVCVHDSDLIVGGRISHGAGGGVPANNICGFDGNGWFALGSGITGGDIYSLLSWESTLFIGGDFAYCGGIPNTHWIGKWDGNNYHPVGDSLQGIIYTMCVYDSVLYAGGYIPLINSQNINNIARLLNYPAQITTNFSMCVGDSYNFNGQMITVAGTYYDTLHNSQGGDSTILKLVLNIVQVDTTISLTGNILFAPGNPGGSTVQWYNCNNWQLIQSATGHTYIASTPGNYAAIITYSGCTDTTACISFTGINEINTAGLNVQLYPNPANETVTITSENINEIVVSNLLGEIVQSSKYKAQRPSVTIDISKLPQGIYLLRVQTNDGWQVGKMVKE